MESYVWQPLAFLNGAKKSVALIQLNTPLRKKDLPAFRQIWQNACIRASVDGAANVLYNCADLDRETTVPDLITGDFDSALPEVLQHYRAKGSEIINTPDQNFTDFTKCVRIVLEKIKKESLQVEAVVGFVCMSGRFDHIMGNIETLYHTRRDTASLPLYLYTADSLTWLLPPGCHRIELSDSVRDHHCGLLPIGAKCQQVTTTGLKWNLDKQCLAFGELVSTSNKLTIPDNTVTVETDQALVWTMSLPLP